MENENMRENENINEEISENAETEAVAAADGGISAEISAETEDVTGEAADTEAEAEETSEEAEVNPGTDEEENLEYDDGVTEYADEKDGESGDYEETETAESDYDAELFAEQEENAKKAKNRRNVIIAAIAAVIVAAAAYCACVVNGVGSKTVVGNPIPTQEGETVSTVKYENPIMSVFDAIALGKNNTAVLKINDETVDRDVFSFVANSAAVNEAYSLYQNGKIKDLDKFDWNEKEEKSGISYKEYSKGEAVQTLVPIYALIGEGRKRGITLSEDEEKELTDWLAQLKTQYGDEFENALKQSGYENENALLGIQRVQMYMQKVYKDLQENVSKYASADKLKDYMSDDKITVKHILIMAKDEEAKPEAKKKAEEVLAKVKAGEDFDKLVEEYNEDPGMTAAGYTFAKDGSMVEEFEKAAFDLEVGQTSDIVETSYGYHIIKRIERGVSIDEYMDMLVDTAKVRLKKGAYDKIDISVNLKDLFGGAADESAAK